MNKVYILPEGNSFYYDGSVLYISSNEDKNFMIRLTPAPYPIRTFRLGSDVDPDWYKEVVEI